ncbi:MAG TPA: outer membrane beta-barrel protein [Gemmatimonadaceae bacterium]|nr:outer membrane beta-barrel protein [Gemmatimonadaceae bacterium]
MTRLSIPRAGLAITIAAAAPLGAQASSPATIQTIPYPAVGLSAGISIPAGGLSRSRVAGFNLAALAEFHTPTEPLGIRGELQYQYFGKKADVTGATSSSSLGATVDVVYHVPQQQVRPYLLGGLGLYVIQHQGTYPGVNVGTGLTIPLPGMTAFAEIRAHTALTQGPSYVTIPLTFGVTF